MTGVAWSVREEQLLRTMYSDSRSFAEMAKALARSSGVTRTPLAVQRKCRKLGLYRQKVTPRVMSVKQAATYYGPKTWRFYDWIRLGLLDHIVVVVKGRRPTTYKLTSDAIEIFFRNPDHWFRWQPCLIKPQTLQVELEALRARHSWRWLDLREAAEIECIGLKTMERRVREGRYPSAVRATSTTHKNGHWFIKSTDLERYNNGN